MNILTITSNDNSIGGASRIAMDIHRGLLERGYGSFVFTGKSINSKQNSGIAEIKRPYWTKILSYVLSNDIDLFQTGYLLSTPEFKFADLIHCHNLHGWYFSLNTLKKMSMLKPVLWTLHDMWAITSRGAHTSSLDLRYGIYNSSDKNLYPYTLWNNERYLAYRKSHLYHNMRINLVSPSKWLIGKIKKSSLSEKKIFYIPNGIDLSVFKIGLRQELLKKHSFTDDPLVLFIGADAENNLYKGFADFAWLASIQSYPKTQFVCLGSRTEGVRKGVRHLVSSSNKNYISEILSCADVLVVTSRYENFPLVILEAMACGTSVLTYDVGGCSEAVQGAPNCMVVAFGDKIALGQSLEKMLHYTQGQGDILRGKLRDHVQKKYSLNSMIDSYINVYKELISSEETN
jgi:glycosyltransferase involved in cell wall biosynthesis